MLIWKTTAIIDNQTLGELGLKQVKPRTELSRAQMFFDKSGDISPKSLLFGFSILS